MNHTHDDYADVSHNHDERYAGVSHTHDYAPTNHTHDEYAEKETVDEEVERIQTVVEEVMRIVMNHTHDEYLTELPEHTHDYAPTSHTHTTLETKTITNTGDINVGGQVKFTNSTVVNDYCRIKCVGNTTNDGALEIATADDGVEPIYIRQYKGNFSELQRTLTLLDANGNTTIPGETTISKDLYLDSDLYLNSNKNIVLGNVELRSSNSNELNVDGRIHIQGEIRAGRSSFGSDGNYSRIKYLGTSGAGSLEIATPVGGNEPIYVRQYSDTFGTVKRTLTLLDESGNTTFPGDLKIDNDKSLYTKWIRIYPESGDKKPLLLYTGAAGGLWIKNENYSTPKYICLYNGSQTVTHKTNVHAEIGTFCESTGAIYDGYERTSYTDCICQVRTATALNKKIVGIVCSEDEFASHGDVYVKVNDTSGLEIGDILCPDENGYGRKATNEDLMFMMLHAIPRPKITSFETNFEGFVACFIV